MFQMHEQGGSYGSSGFKDETELEFQAKWRLASMITMQHADLLGSVGMWDIAEALRTGQRENGKSTLNSSGHYSTLLMAQYYPTYTSMWLNLAYRQYLLDEFRPVKQMDRQTTTMTLDSSFWAHGMGLSICWICEILDILYCFIEPDVSWSDP